MKLKMGLIGTGGIAFDKHLPEYAKLSDRVTIAAAADVSEANLDRACQTYNIPKRFTDYKQLLALDELDFVVVALPNTLHAQVSIEALQSGKHVHCEKPMATAAADAEAMVAAAAKAGRTLMIGLNNRFLPQTTHVKKLIDDGALGEIYHVNAFWKRDAGLPFSAWQVTAGLAGGGCLTDIGVHMLDLSLYLLGFPAVSEVRAASHRKFSGTPDRAAFTYNGVRLPDGLPFDTEDLVSAWVRFDNTTTLSLECSWASFIEEECAGYDLYGTKGGVQYRKRPGKQPELKIFTLQNGQLTASVPRFAPVVFDPSEFTHFLDCVGGAKVPPVADPVSAVHTVRLIEAIYAQAKP